MECGIDGCFMLLHAVFFIYILSDEREENRRRRDEKMSGGNAISNIRIKGQ